MDFTLPEHLPGVLAEMDAFIDVEIKPLEREHIQYFDQRREYARTDWDNGGIPRRDWEDLLGEMKAHDRPFLATKVWTTGQEAGIASMEKSLAKLQTKNIDLMQVHNLIDAKTHLATLRDWKEQGRARYLGMTHYSSSAYSEVARLLRSEKLDFLQINYSLLEREAEKEILPLARERGIERVVAS